MNLNDSLRMSLLSLLAREPTDIHQHVMTLANLARESRSVVELGTRTGVSTIALFLGGIGREEARGPAFGGGWNARNFAMDSYDVANCGGDVYQNLDRLIAGSPVPDPYDQASREALVVLPECFRRHVQICQEDSIKASARWNTLGLDLLFIDTTHTFEQTAAELAAWDRCIAERGIIAGHDSFHPDYGVRDAVIDFFGRNQDRYLPPVFHDWNNGLFILRRRS